MEGVSIVPDFEKGKSGRILIKLASEHGGAQEVLIGRQRLGKRMGSPRRGHWALEEERETDSLSDFVISKRKLKRG